MIKKQDYLQANLVAGLEADESEFYRVSADDVIERAKKRNDTRFDRFVIRLFLDQDSEWLAHFEELPHISAFGNSPEEALKELGIAWSQVKQSYIEKGEEVPQSIANKRFNSQYEDNKQNIVDFFQKSPLAEYGDELEFTRDTDTGKPLKF